MTENKDNWDACPTGAISRMVSEISAKRRKQGWMQFGGAAAAIVVVGAVVVAVAMMSRPSAITCPECVTMMADYESGELDSDYSARVAFHLENCPSCQEHFDRSFHHPNGSTSNSSADRATAMLSR